MGFYDAFFGSDQSQYTAYAIVAAIIAICITILLTATDIPVSNRLLIVFFVIISLIPSVFLTLFELTCIVTGGTEPNKWWCYAFAWVLAAFIIIYCIFIVIISLISLFTYNNAIDNIKDTEDKARLSPEVSNTYAKQIIATDEKREKHIEKFYSDQMNNETQEDKIEKFGSTYYERQVAQSAADRAAAERAAERAAADAKRARDAAAYNNDLNKAQSKQSRNSLPIRRIGFTDYGSVKSNEQFDDSNYFLYDDFKQN